VHKNGQVSIVETRGNEDCHVILRGGKKPNYDAAGVRAAAEALAKAGLAQRLMIDCSHANSDKDPMRQLAVAADVGRQVGAGDERIFGVMVESHLTAGRQELIAGHPLVYGQSVTDGCIGWEESVPLLEDIAAAVRLRRQRRLKNAERG